MVSLFSTEIDECAEAPCQHCGVCHDLLDGYGCDCSVGYEGASCDIGKQDKNNFSFSFSLDSRRSQYVAAASGQQYQLTTIV